MIVSNRGQYHLAASQTLRKQVMSRSAERCFTPYLLCIVPPFATTCPPAGAAYLLGYLKANGCTDFSFLDLCLGVPEAYTPTFSYTGVFAEAYVMDIPDLPLVLQLLDAYDKGSALVPNRSEVFDRYCLERAISPHHLHSYLAGLDHYLAAAFEQIPDLKFVGFSVWVTNYLSTLLAAAHLKRRKVAPLIVAGGPQVTASHASAALGLQSGLFDVVTLGEGEATLLDVANEYSRNRGGVNNVPGSLWIDSSSNVLSGAERRLTQMPLLPTPSFADMNLAAYQSEAGYRTFPLQMSRGCPDTCEFCGERIFWRQFRADTADNTVDRIKELQRTYDANFITFSDSLLNAGRERLTAFAERLIKESIDIGWAAFMRAEMDSKTAKLIARSGCHGVFVGIESFEDETLALMNKRRTKADNVRAIEAFLDAGIGVTAGFIPGFPCDTREAFVHSVTVFQHLQQRYPGQLDIHVEPFLVQPNAPIYAKLEKMGLIPIPWADEYVDLAPRYRDISSNVLCMVQGESQGIERLGRLSIVKTIATCSLHDDNEESLGTDEFCFEHIDAGWYLAEKKSQAGHVYALLVNQQEREEIEELQATYSLKELSKRPVVLTIARLERAHLIPPERKSLRVVRCVHRKHVSDGDKYAISPFVVARTMDWRDRRQILVVNFVSDRRYRIPAKAAGLIEFVRKKPRTNPELWRFAERQDIPPRRTDLRRTVDRLKDDGIFVICDVKETQSR